MRRQAGSLSRGRGRPCLLGGRLGLISLLRASLRANLATPTLPKSAHPGPRLPRGAPAPCPPPHPSRSKVDGERAVQARWPHQRQLILRPSIIYGPPPPNPIRRGQFLQYIDTSLAAQVSP